jgi:hypothetical protein
MLSGTAPTLSGTTPTTTTTTLPCSDEATLQIDIDNASAGDLISVCAGSHGVNLTIPVDLVLDGEGAATLFGGGLGLQEGGLGPVVTVLEGVHFTARGFEITGGDGEDAQLAGAIDAGLAASLTVENCDIWGNNGFTAGGVAGAGTDSTFLEVRQTTLVNTTIRDNSGFLAGGLKVTSADLSDVQITDNFSPFGGGMVMVLAGEVIASNSEVRNNLSTIGGAGVVMTEGSTLQGLTIAENVGGSGSGVTMLNPGGAALIDVVIADNEAVYVFETSGHGGGIFAYGTGSTDTVLFQRVTVVGNDSIGSGGGVYVQGNPGRTELFEDCNITDNTALNGAGIGAVDGAAPTIAMGSMLRNSATNGGGGVWLDSYSLVALTGVDLGVGADVNSPDDVYMELSGDSMPAGSGVVTVVCEGTIGVCQ